MSVKDLGHPSRGAQVEVRDFGWRHAGRKNPVLAGLNLRIEPGEKVLLLGASGTGKSTLLGGIAGVLGDSEDGEQQGSIRVGGLDPARDRGMVGMVLQDPDSQVIAAKLGDDAVFGCENLGVSREDMWPRAQEALQLVGLGSMGLDHPTEHLSGGQKQRLALAGVLAMGPRVIVLDEPTANLDPEGVAEVRDAVLKACRATGATLVVVEHRVATWSEHMDRVVVLGRTGGTGYGAPASGGTAPSENQGLPSGVLADGPVAEVLGTHGEQLAEAGIWVPGAVPDLQPLPATLGSGGNTLLRLGELTVGWPAGIGADEATIVHTAINAELQPGSTCLTGANGAGKSTLALTIAGLLPSISGEVDATGLTQGEKNPLRRLGRQRKQTDPYSWRSKDLVRRIGYVFQSPEHQFAARTVREELLLGPEAVGMDAAAAEKRADELLELLGLSALAAANPFTLSGGEKRRLSVAAVLATRPGLVILDEPTFGQDLKTFTTLVHLLQELAESGTSLLSITHDSTYLQALGQHHWHLPAAPGMEVRA